MSRHVMSVTTLVSGLLLLVALLACKGSSSGEGENKEAKGGDVPKGLYVDLGDGKKVVEPKTAVAKLRPDLRQLQVLVANYDNAVTDSIMAAPQAKEPGQLKVVFYVKGDGKEFQRPVEPGEYDVKSINAAYVSKGGESSDIGFTGSDKKPSGKLVFKTIDDEKVVGTVELEESGKTISGSFEVKFLPED